ncbi:hypothetical protein N9L47_11345 [Rhodobacteraceae bacterium]|nr:hypothetical protein [Paracoccaceae bacterium]
MKIRFSAWEILSRAMVTYFLFASQAFAQHGELKTYAFKQQGYQRQFILYSPRGFEGPQVSLPLVVVLHGGGGTARQMIRLSRSRWNELADEHGFLVVYPNAVDKIWDFGKGAISEALSQRVNDLEYFKSVIARVQSLKNVDSDRIFATGISRGGQASYYLACNLPSKIRAIMPVAMPLPTYLVDECQNGPPIGIAIMNGTEDQQVPYNGGTIVVLGKPRDKVLSTSRTLEIWTRQNRCGGLAFKEERDRVAKDRTSVSIRQWNCDAAPVWLFQINGGGHTWPSGRQYLPVRLVGRTSREVDAAEEGWRFLSQF